MTLSLIWLPGSGQQLIYNLLNNAFSEKLPIIFPLINFLIIYVQGLVFVTESIANISLDQILVSPFLKIFLYLVILTLSPPWNLRALGFVSISSVNAE